MVRMQFLLAALCTVLGEAVADSKILLHTKRPKKTMKLEGADMKNLTKLEDPVGQILPYWEPEPMPDTRRKMNMDKSFKIKPLERTSTNLGDDGPNVQWSSHEGDKEVRKRHQGVKIAKKPNLLKDKELSSKERQDSNLKVNLKMRLQKMSAKNEEPPVLRSTRVAPLHLMQQAKSDEDKAGPKKDDSLSESIILNSYAVEQQISKILSGFKEAEFTTEILGRTASYIDIMLFKISQRGNTYFRAVENKYIENEKKEKKILFIVHALSPMGLANVLSLTYGTNMKILLSYYIKHLDNFDIYLMPLANPDGYAEVRKKTYWNKNVAPNAACRGVNVDRNFDVAWNHSEQINSCSQHFPGVAPFSEPESRAVRDVFHRMSHKIVAYFHVHAGTYDRETFKGDAVLYPKGYTDQQSDDDKYMDLKGEIDEEIKDANFKVLSVTVDTLYNWYGKVSGTSVDYAATVYGIPYAMELVMQVYQDASEAKYTHIFAKNEFKLETIETSTLAEIWQRIINVIFTNIHEKLEANEAN